MIADMDAAERKLRASLSGQVRVFSQAEIDAVADELEPPRPERVDYRHDGFVE